MAGARGEDTYSPSPDEFECLRPATPPYHQGRRHSQTQAVQCTHRRSCTLPKSMEKRL